MLLLVPDLRLLLLQPHSGKGLPHVGRGAMCVLKRRVQDRFQGAPCCYLRALEKADGPLSRVSICRGGVLLSFFIILDCRAHSCPCICSRRVSRGAFFPCVAGIANAEVLSKRKSPGDPLGGNAGAQVPKRSSAQGTGFTPGASNLLLPRYIHNGSSVLLNLLGWFASASFSRAERFSSLRRV